MQRRKKEENANKCKGGKKKQNAKDKLLTDMPKTQNFVFYLSVSKTKPHSKGEKEEKKK